MKVTAGVLGALCQKQGQRSDRYFLQYFTISVFLPTEKPVLQSRHSLDGSKLVEKVESPQPLWITLALQKQKGFREQQATREERKQAREASQAEKLCRENVSSLVLSLNFVSPSLALF